MIIRHLLPIVFCAAALGVCAASPAQFKTIHSFCAAGGTACTDGDVPQSPLVSNAAGTLLYGSTGGGGANGQGTIFSLTRHANAWTHKVLVDFCGSANCADGANPKGGLVIDTQGNLYGATSFGGLGDVSTPGHGTVFKLTSSGELVVLYRFCAQANCVDGWQPEAGLTYAGAASGLPYDGTSPLYGTTNLGGAHNKGTVFQISFSGGVATRKTLYDFCSAASCTDGWRPMTALTIDGSGNIIGTVMAGGAHEQGAIFKLSPAGGGAWTEAVLHSFCALSACVDGGIPGSGVLIDGAGNMFGAASNGVQQAGVLYRLSGLQYTVLHAFCSVSHCRDGVSPGGSMAMDAAGSLFGVSGAGGAKKSRRRGGVVFRWSAGEYKVLHSFCVKHKCRDGNGPQGVLLDSLGNLVGTAQSGGENGPTGGTVFKLRP